MLLITGKHSDRLPNVTMVATRNHLPLSVANRASALENSLTKNRRNVVILDEGDIDDEMAGVLASFATEPNLKLLVMTTSARPAAATKHRLKLLESVIWLTPEIRFEALSALVGKLRDEMLEVTHVELEQAFTERELRVRYQPKVVWSGDENRWNTAEVEALVRWRHPEHGLLGPRHFLPEIEQFGYMERLTDYVLGTSVEQLKAWEETGLKLNGCINLAPSLLDITGLARRYREMLMDEGMPCERFCFELPTSGILHRGKERAKVVAKLREAGFKIAIDDFGADGQAMQIFEVLEFDELKIHASLLSEGAKDPETLKSLSALTGLARNLDISICAEGVETEEMFDLVQTIHCDKMQGYLVSEAVMPDIIQHHHQAQAGAINEESGVAHLM